MEREIPDARPIRKNQRIPKKEIRGQEPPASQKKKKLGEIPQEIKPKG